MKGRDKRRRNKERRVRSREFGVRGKSELAGVAQFVKDYSNLKTAGLSAEDFRSKKNIVNDDIQKLIDLPQKIAKDAKGVETTNSELRTPDASQFSKEAR